MSNTLSFKDIEDEFTRALQLDWEIPDDLKEKGQEMVESLSAEDVRTASERREELFALVSSKLHYNKQRKKKLIDSMAGHQVIFNKPQKDRIREFLDRRDKEGFTNWVSSLDVSRPIKEAMLDLFNPLEKEEILSNLHDDLESESDKKSQKILRAIFGGYISGCFDLESIHKYFNSKCEERYFESFFKHLQFYYADSLDRSNTLSLLNIDDNLIRQFDSDNEFFDSLFTFADNQYEYISNHCFLAVYVRTGDKIDKSMRWKIYSKLSLYSENLDSHELDKKYFRSEEIEEATRKHIPEIDLESANFEKVNEGFQYKDCFIIEDKNDKYNLLILLQKHVRDETVIPCPVCRSKNVQGNSYPDLGVRSWECKNPLCPDKSKSDRGERYSLRSIIQQEAIEKKENQIPDESLKKWRLDVTSVESDHEVLDLLVRHYTLHGDRISLYNIELDEEEWHGRHLQFETLPNTDNGLAARFFDSSFFHRYIYEKEEEPSNSGYKDISEYPGMEVYSEKAYSVLQEIETESIDGAVTSPPYYNAKEYAVWPNIYTYLYDMYNVAIEMKRVLKNGSLFLYNIFDHFDNEMNIATSAMGKKRIPLGAYTIDIFERAGFKLIDNIVWHKGEVETTRNYNQGNKSPYYQDPHPCWEHIFIFSKGKPDLNEEEYPSIFRKDPVFKYSNGENILGHEAPFPEAIPGLLLDMIGGEDPVVLDPFAGVLTTGRAAYKQDVRSINIDYKKKYCKRGLEILDQQVEEPPLFAR